MGIDSLRRGDHLFLRCIHFTIQDVVTDSPMENKIILSHDAHLFAQTLDADLCQIVAIDQNFTLFNIIEAADQVYDGRLSGTGRSHQRNGLPRLNGEIHVLQNLRLCRSSLVIGKGHVGKFDFSLDIRKFFHVLIIVNIRVRIQNIKDTLCRRQIRHYLIVKVAQIHDWIPKHIDIGSECNQKTNGHLRCTDVLDAHKIEHHRAEAPAEINGRSKQIGPCTGFDKGISVLLYQILEDFAGLLLCGKALYNPHSCNILMHICIEVGGFLPSNLPQLMRRCLNCKDCNDHDRNRTKRCQRQLPILDGHDHNNADYRDEIRNQGCNRIAQHFLKRVDISDNSRQNLSGRSAVKK